MSALGATASTAPPVAPPPVAPTAGAPTSPGAPLRSLPTAAGPPATSIPMPPATTASALPAGGITSVQSSTAPVSGEDPHKAIDALAEPTILDKAKVAAKPYLDKVESTTKPYLDRVQATVMPYANAAQAKATELVDKIEGNNPYTPVPSATMTASTATPPSTTTTTAAPSTAPPSTLEKSISSAQASTAAATEPIVNPNRRASLTQQVEARAQGLFAAVTSSFNQLTTTIDEKTKTPTHPGIISQVTAAVEKGVAKVDQLLGDAPAGTNATTTSPAAHPVMTTTNTMPHAVDAEGKPTTTTTATSSMLPSSLASGLSGMIPP